MPVGAGRQAVSPRAATSNAGDDLEPRSKNRVFKTAERPVTKSTSSAGAARQRHEPLATKDGDETRQAGPAPHLRCSQERGEVQSVATHHLEIFHAEGPGDVIRIQAIVIWLNAEDDPGQMALTFSSRFADFQTFAKPTGADAYIVASGGKKRTFRDGKSVSSIALSRNRAVESSPIVRDWLRRRPLYHGIALSCASGGAKTPPRHTFSSCRQARVRSAMPVGRHHTHHTARAAQDIKTY